MEQYERIAELERQLKVALELAEANEVLATCYRVGKAPSDRQLDRITKAKDALKEKHEV